MNEAIEEAGYVEDVIVFDRLGTSSDTSENDVPWTDDRDEWWTDAVESRSDEYETKSLPSDQESMLLYSSGTTGKPKGSMPQTA